MNSTHESLGSRLGFILISAGCAIGLGNVWMFPWRVGNNGGAAFVFVYILALLVLGLPVMTAEFTIGRAAQRSPICMYQELSKPKFQFHGWLSLAGNCFLMMFYTTIAGYFFHYLFNFIEGNTETLTYAATTANVGVNVGYMILVIALGIFVISFNLQTGIEKITKVMMLCLFALLLVLAVHSLTMSGTKEGLSFYLKPDFSLITGSVIVAGMKQAFFSLSLGMGSMAIFGSYIGKDHSLLGESAIVIALDTFVALVAGLIIFPACFTFGINPDAGPPLLFTTMTTVFNNMQGGRIWGSLFFLFMIFAAMSTVIAVLENILAMLRDILGWNRKKTCNLLFAGMVLLCLPMAFTGNIWNSFQPFHDGAGFLSLWSFFVETIIQPLGSVTYLVFVTQKFGMGWESFLAEANAGGGMKVRPWMIVFFKYITPAIIFALWIYGIVTTFI